MVEEGNYREVEKEKSNNEERERKERRQKLRSGKREIIRYKGNGRNEEENGKTLSLENWGREEEA